MSSEDFLRKCKAKIIPSSKSSLLTDFSEKPKPVDLPKKVVAVNPFFEVVSNEEKNVPKEVKKRKIDYTESVFSREDLQFEVKVNKVYTPTEEKPIIKIPQPAPLSSKHGHQTKWDLELWIDEAIPSSFTDLECFVSQTVDQMETGDRNQKAKPDENTNKVLKGLDETILNWKKGKKKVHCFIGGPSTGKTLMLKLAAKKHNLEWCPIHEDNPVELKRMLANAGNVSLDNAQQQLWVIEHFDFFDKACKAILRGSLPKLLQSGPVFITMYPVNDIRSFQQFTLTNCLQWPLSAKIMYLEKFGPPKLNWEHLYAEGNGEIPRILSYGQYSRNIISQESERFCGKSTCQGFCSICTRKRRIPHNLRLLVEDTLCPRTSATKEKMLSETDADLSLMLLHEMIPFTNCSLDSLRRSYDAISLLDCCTEYSTFMKDAFLSGTLQTLSRTEDVNFSSKNNLPIPEMLFGKNRRTVQGDSKKETQIALYRGCKNYIPRKRCTLAENDEEDRKTKGLVEDSEQKKEYEIGDAQVDVRDLFEDISLFQQASNL